MRNKIPRYFVRHHDRTADQLQYQITQGRHNAIENLILCVPCALCGAPFPGDK